MSTIKVNFNVDEKLRDELRLETLKRKTTMTTIVVAFFRAWLKKDPRALAIVDDYNK